MRTKVLAIVVSVIAFCGVQRAMAWGGFAHTGIAYIAEQHLKPEVKEKCHHYLKHTLTYYAEWMDTWRGVPEFDCVNKPHTIRAKSDGVNLDWNGRPPGRCMGFLKSAIEELGEGKYKNLPDSVVRQRIINMVHYIPDMHCPSHVMFNKGTFSHYYYNIYNKGKLHNFHGFWDWAQTYKREIPTCKEYAELIDHASKREIKRWQKGTLDDWGRDIIKQAHLRYQLTPVDTDVAKLSKEEVAKIHALCDEMALKAAYRLAYVLNTIFAK